MLQAAIELFAARGYDAVSVREITRSLGMNEASLYNHFSGKEDLLSAIFQRFSRKLTESPPGEAETLPPPPRTVDELVRYLQLGGRAFFARQGVETQRIWRILMMCQYHRPEARDNMKAAILDLPRSFFGAILGRMKEAGDLPERCDCEAGARIIAALYVEYSLRAILDAAWDRLDPHDLDALDRDLELAVRAITA